MPENPTLDLLQTHHDEITNALRRQQAEHDAQILKLLEELRTARLTIRTLEERIGELRGKLETPPTSHLARAARAGVVAR